MTSPANHPAPSPKKPNSITAVRQEFSGPLPPPNVLQEYDRIVPGAAERILVMAEQQSANRRELERCVIRANSRNETLSIIAAVIVVLGAFAWATYAVAKGQSAKGSAAVICMIVSLAGTFAYGKYQTSRERLERRRLANERMKQDQ